MRKHKIQTTRASKKRCFLLLAILSCIYLLNNLPSFGLNSSELYIYIIKPMIWCGAIGIVWFFPRIKSNGKLRLRGSLNWWTVYLSIFYIIAMFFGGFIYGFGKSPYDLSPSGIIKNFILVGSMVVGREFIRAYIVNNIPKKNFMLGISIFTLFMTFVNLPLERILSLNGGIDILQYLSECFLPELAKNVMATYLVYLGGQELSIIYVGIIEAFFWFSPILPDLQWIMKGLIGILCPAFSLMFLQYKYNKSVRIKTDKNNKNENPIGLILTSILCIGIVWFSLGVFPVHPDVIATGSMRPMIYPGDMVLIKRMDGNDVKKGDVIQFKRENIYIFHRIIDITMVNNEKRYVTKGDNNSVKDSELVSPDDVKGKVIYVIPKIGWPTLLFKDTSKVPKNKVEF